MISRRQFLRGSGAISAVPALLPGSRGVGWWLRGQKQPPDYQLEIAPCSIEVSRGSFLRTIAYNGQVPGPLLRLREGRFTIVDVVNRTGEPNVVHWHGLRLPSAIDGATEEGTPAIAAGALVRYALLGDPAGLRWYHTHTFAGGSTNKAQYTGQHGLLLVDPANDPARYDRELFLTLHDWRGQMLSSNDGSMNPVYDISTINGRVLGFGDPVRVRQGERALLHILNSSPTEVHWLSFSGHTFHVLALDGNAVPRPSAVSMLRLAPAERVSAIVEMNHPGIWVLGETRKHVQAAGMGIVVEYAGATGEPVWQQPESLAWSYSQFGSDAAIRQSAPHPAIKIPLVFQARFAGHGAMEKWTINGKSYPDVTSPKLRLGQRYQLILQNRSQDDHPLHLHRHRFELVSISDESGPVRGIQKDTVLIRAGQTGVVEFVADDPGRTLFLTAISRTIWIAAS